MIDRARSRPTVSAPCPVFGFVLRATFDASEGNRRDEVGAFKSELIELLEANALMPHGAGDGVLQHDRGPDGVIVIFSITREGAQAADGDRQLVTDWATRWAKVARITVSDLIDLTQLAE